MKKFIALSVLVKGYRFSLTPLLLPALPALVLYLNVPSYQVKYLISFLSLGSMITKIYLILLGDRINTKYILLLAVPCGMIGAILGLCGTIVTVLLSGIFLSIGMSVGNTLVPKILKKANPDDYVTVSVGKANLIGMFFPMIAVVSSGYIVEYINWRGIYYVLLIISTLLLLMVVQAKLPKDAIKKSSKIQLLQIKEMLKNRQYVFLALIQSSLYSISIILAIVIPFLVIQHMHNTAQMYAFLCLPSYVFSIIGIYVCIKVAPLVSQRTLLLIFYTIILIDIIFLYFTNMHAVSTNWVIVISMSLYYFSFNGISNYVNAHSAVFFPSSMATAASILSLIRNAFILVVGFIASHLDDSNLSSLTYFMSILFLLSLIFLIALRPSTQTRIGSQEKGVS